MKNRRKKEEMKKTISLFMIFLLLVTTFSFITYSESVSAIDNGAAQECPGTSEPPEAGQECPPGTKEVEAPIVCCEESPPTDCPPPNEWVPKQVCETTYKAEGKEIVDKEGNVCCTKWKEGEEPDTLKEKNMADAVSKAKKPDLWGRLTCKAPTGKSASEAWVECVFNWISIALGIVRATNILAGTPESAYGTCKPEIPIIGVADQEEACKSCNADPLRICTEERCEILGNCIPLAPEEGTLEEMASYTCIPGKCDETELVIIDSIRATFYAGGVKTNKPSPNPQYKAADKLIISNEVAFNADFLDLEITNDKLAQCRYSFEPQQEFEEMENFDDNYYPGTYDEPLPQEVMIPLPGTLARDMQHTLYIKCSNVCGKAHDRADDNHFMRFKFEKKPDQLPPIIVAMDPENNGVVSGDISTFKVEFQLDEWGYCQYSDNWTLEQGTGNPAPLTTEWQDMIDFETGQHQPGSSVVGGNCSKGQCQDLRTNDCAYCTMNLDLRRGFTNISWDNLPPELQEQIGVNGTSKFFHFKIRCADLPRENVMVEEDTLDYFFFTMPPFPIDIIKPEMNEATYDVTPEIHVTTDDRDTECRYSVKPAPCSQQYPAWDDMIDIDGTFSSEHIGEVEEPLEPAVGGKPYCTYFRCRDQWLLEKKATVSFRILLDKDLPIVIRMYHDVFAGDYLLIETNEDSTCVYGADDEIACNYMFEDGNEMTGTNETLHTAYWTLDHLYYIRCVDIWGNVLPKGQCTVILNPFEIPAIPF